MTRKKILVREETYDYFRWRRIYLGKRVEPNANERNARVGGRAAWNYSSKKATAGGTIMNRYGFNLVEVSSVKHLSAFTSIKLRLPSSDHRREDEEKRDAWELLASRHIGAWVRHARTVKLMMRKQRLKRSQYRRGWHGIRLPRQRVEQAG